MFAFEGWLPIFLLYTGVAAILHASVCFLASSQTSMKLFSGPGKPQQKDLLARTYGLKNVYTGLIRLFAAFNIGVGPVYNLAMCTFVGVLLFTLLEVGVYNTIRPREATVGLCTSSLALVWMFLQRDFYIQL